MILNRAKDYYEKNKERLREKAKDEYRNLSEEDKNKKKKREKTDTTIYLKKRNKKEKNTRKNIEMQQSLNIIINEIAF